MRIEASSRKPHVMASNSRKQKAETETIKTAIHPPI
jgi:hypothetical protein